MKYITFSTKFPLTHPKAGEPTNFVAKITKSFLDQGIDESPIPEVYKNYIAKNHTIRSGNRWKDGDQASLRIWTGRPYNSPQLEFSKAFVKTYKFILTPRGFKLNGKKYNCQKRSHFDLLEKIAINDGLTLNEFLDWFYLSPDFKKKRIFKGQIICWNDEIKY